MSDRTRVVIFTSDRGYLVPTLVAATQVLAQSGVTALADVIIFLIGFTASEVDRLRAEFGSTRLFFSEMDTAFHLPPGVIFAESHVPVTALARLFTPDLLPVQYEHVVYLDGDVQIHGDLAPLVAFDVAPGRILAATDRHFLSIERIGYLGSLRRKAQSYLSNLGVTGEIDYFNSGVLAAGRLAWGEICADALRYFYAHSDTCIYHDQSALNVAARGRRDHLSPLYNFTTAYAATGLPSRYSPVVTHFTGSDKPWLFDDREPWGSLYAQPYRDILAAHPMLAPYAAAWPAQSARLASYATKPARLGSGLVKMVYTQLKRRRLAHYLRTQTFAV